MKLNIKQSDWWGAPKKFTTASADRKISWLELFFDLVYVIAFARITHYLSEHPDLSHFFNYCYLFAIVYWGWLNGSLYYDLHGSEGLRTRLMMMWQMLIIASLIIIIDGHRPYFLRDVTIVIAVMQAYITYLWWSVGIYDPAHRKQSSTYILLFLCALVLLLASLLAPSIFIRPLLSMALLLNYLPPVVNSLRRHRNASEIRLSSSMSERLGLLAIILFGELMSNIISGASIVHTMTFTGWLTFAEAVVITFALWWLFFTMVSDRLAKQGQLVSTMLELIFIPTLMALSIAGMALHEILHTPLYHGNFISYEKVIGYALAVFLGSTVLLTLLLEFPPSFSRLKVQAQRILLAGVCVLILIPVFSASFQPVYFLLCLLGGLLVIITLLNIIYYRFSADR